MGYISLALRPEISYHMSTREPEYSKVERNKDIYTRKSQPRFIIVQISQTMIRIEVEVLLLSKKLKRLLLH